MHRLNRLTNRSLTFLSLSLSLSLKRKQADDYKQVEILRALRDKQAPPFCEKKRIITSFRILITPNKLRIKQISNSSTLTE